MTYLKVVDKPRTQYITIDFTCIPVWREHPIYEWRIGTGKTQPLFGEVNLNEANYLDGWRRSNAGVLEINEGERERERGSWYERMQLCTACLGARARIHLLLLSSVVRPRVVSVPRASTQTIPIWTRFHRRSKEGGTEGGRDGGN